MNLEGDLRSVSLPRVLLSIGGQDGKGILTVQGDEDIVAVSFLDGEIVTADALNETVEEGLGRVLRRRGLVDAEQFRGVAAEHQGGSEGSLGDLLVERGLVERKQLLESLRIQTFRQMFKILTWRQGEFKFYSGDEVSHEEGFTPIAVEELLVRAIDKLGEKVGLVGPLPSLDDVYRQVPPRGKIQVYGRDGDGGVGIWITPEQASFLGKVDGSRRGKDVARDLGLNRFKAVYALYNLLQFDLIESASRGGAKASPFADEDPQGAVFQPSASPGGTGAGPSPTTGGGGEAAVFADEVAAEPTAPAEPRQPPERRPAPEARPEAREGQRRQRPRPAPEARPQARTRAEPPLPAPTGAVQWVGPGLAVLLLVGIFLAMVLRPAGLLLPFPWQENSRSTFERQIRQSLFRKVDRAAKTHYLIESEFPESLDQLVARGLIAPADLADPAGYDLVYTDNETSYRIVLQDGDHPVEGLGTTEAITGDFLVDPQFLATASEPPLVLLD